MTECCCKSQSGELKTKYTTFEEADAIKRARKMDGIDVWIYRCPVGDGFHLTSHSQGDGVEAENQQLVRKHTKSKQRNVNTKLYRNLDEEELNDLLALINDLRKHPKKSKR